MNRQPQYMKRRQGGIALLEVLIAVVLLAVGLLGTVGLQARAYAALNEAGMRAEATLAAERLLGVMTTDLAHLSDYDLAGEPPAAGKPTGEWYKRTTAQIPNAKITVKTTPGAVASAPSLVTILITWQRKADAPENKHEVRAYI